MAQMLPSGARIGDSRPQHAKDGLELEAARRDAD